MSKSRLWDSLRCPNCHSSPLLHVADPVDTLSCSSCNCEFVLAAGRPVLIRSDNQVFKPADYRALPAGDRRPGWQRFIPSPSVNLSRERVVSRLRELLASGESRDVLVVGSGGQRKDLDAKLQCNVVYSDVDPTADVDLFCDAHDLPFIDQSFDAVITTAVLEHVLYPERVASEICRVLKPGGFLYSELPFMQQVHGRAYDFTRYSLSGHRRLFNRFRELESGMVAGPATAMVWAMEHLALSFVSHPTVRSATKAAARVIFAPLKHFDRLLQNRPEAIDAASCTYFLGQKSETPVPDAEIVSGYTGGAN